MTPRKGQGASLLGLEQFRADAAAARRFAEAEHAAATCKGYRADLAVFAAWCAERALIPLPATPETLAAFLASQAEAGRKPSTIARRLAALRQAHARAGLPSPTSSEIVRATSKGIRRTLRVVPQQKAPATVECLAGMLKQVPTTLAGTRDRAILLVGFAGAFRRSELCALTVEDLTFRPEGILIRLRQSKTDPEGTGELVTVPAGEALCPVKALRAWLDASGLTLGALFRSFRKGGRLRDAALTPHSIGSIVKSYAGAAGFDPAAFGGHSLRSGFLTSAAERGSSLWQLRDASRHRSLQVLQGYVRARSGFQHHPAQGLL